MQYVPSARPANQDRRYFPLGTSSAPMARNWGSPTMGRGRYAKGSTDAEKLENGLTALLGSREAAKAYIRERKASKER
jgi:hypothetical protein